MSGGKDLRSDGGGELRELSRREGGRSVVGLREGGGRFGAVGGIEGDGDDRLGQVGVDDLDPGSRKVSYCSSLSGKESSLVVEPRLASLRRARLAHVVENVPPAPNRRRRPEGGRLPPLAALLEVDVLSEDSARSFRQRRQRVTRGRVGSLRRTVVASVTSACYTETASRIHACPRWLTIELARAA